MEGGALQESDSERSHPRGQPVLRFTQPFTNQGGPFHRKQTSLPVNCLEQAEVT